MLKPIRRLKRALMSKLIESGAPSGGTENPSLAAQLDGHLTFCAIASALKDGRPFLAGRLGWFETYALGHWDRLGSLTESLKNKMSKKNLNLLLLPNFWGPPQSGSKT